MARKKIRGKAGVKFKSPYTSEKRDSQLRTLVTHLIIHEEVKVTETTAKSVVSLASKMITFAKKGDLHSRRLAAAVVRPILVNENQTALQKLFDEIKMWEKKEKLEKGKKYMLKHNYLLLPMY